FGYTSTLTLPSVYFSASSLNFSAALPLDVSEATTWLNLMTVRALADTSPTSASAAIAAAANTILRMCPPGRLFCEMRGSGAFQNVVLSPEPIQRRDAKGHCPLAGVLQSHVAVQKKSERRV